LAACSAAWARRAGAGSPEPHAHAGLAAAAVHAPLARSRADGAATLASCSRRGRREPGGSGQPSPPLAPAKEGGRRRAAPAREGGWTRDAPSRAGHGRRLRCAGGPLRAMAAALERARRRRGLCSSAPAVPSLSLSSELGPGQVRPRGARPAYGARGGGRREGGGLRIDCKKI